MLEHNAQVSPLAVRQERSGNFDKENSMTRRFTPHSLLLAATIGLTACGQFNFFTQKSAVTDRKVASAVAEQLISGSEQTFSDELDDQIQSLHQYYVIGHKHLDTFDRLLETKSLPELYESNAYKSLIVTRELAGEIEESLLEAHEDLIATITTEDSKEERDIALGKIFQMYTKVRKFSENSEVQRSSVENLSTRIQTALKTVSWPRERTIQDRVQTLVIESLKSKQIAAAPLSSDLESNYKAEFLKLSEQSDFVIQQKNIDHLSLTLDIETSPNEQKIYPTSGKAGNITGNEFPAKVWALTFDDGPGKASTLEILGHLKKRNLKASFFQLAQQVKANPTVSKAIKEAGMEIASHSWSHQQLTKVGPTTLEKEITLATKEIEKFYDIDVQYFRLPYGAGVSTASIREKIADNKLVHVFWNIDTLDWMSQTPDKIVDRTISMMKKTSKDAGIILMHDIHNRTAIASAQVMDYLQKDNRRTCTVGEIVDQINQGVAEVCSQK